MAQHVRAAEPGLVGPLRQRGGRRGRGRPGRAPPTGRRDCTSGRAWRASWAISSALSSTSSNTADQRTLASWRAPTTVLWASSEVDPERRRRARGATGRARGRRSPAATSRSPVTVMSRHASSWLRTTSPRRRPPARSSSGKMPLEAGAAAPSTSARRCGGAVTSMPSTGAEPPAVARGREHRQVPGAALVGRVELDDERDVRGALDRPRPLLEPVDELARGPQRRVEDAAVEPGEDRLGDVGLRAHVGRRCGHLDAAGAVAADRVDHPGERGAGERTGVDARIDRSDAPGHLTRHLVQAARLDQRGRPPDRERRVRAAGGARAPAPLAQQRHHRALRGELDCPDRDPARASPRSVRRRRPGPRPRRPATPAPRRPALRARRRPRRRAARSAVCSPHGADGAPVPRRAACATSSRSAASRPGPPPQATTRPGSHDTWSRTSPGSIGLLAAATGRRSRAWGTPRSSSARPRSGSTPP